MTFTEQIITIAAVVAGTMLTRFLPFILFPANKKTPPLVAFLGKMLPAAVMGMLVVYSLKDTQIMTGSHGIPEAIAVALTVILQATLRNLLLTIAAGTICCWCNMYLCKEGSKASTKISAKLFYRR